MIKVTSYLTWFFFGGYLYNYINPLNPYCGNILIALHLLEVYFWGVFLILCFFRLMLTQPNAKIIIDKVAQENIFKPTFYRKSVGYFKQMITLGMAVFFAVVLGKFRLAFLFLSQLILSKGIYDKAKKLIQ